MMPGRQLTREQALQKLRHYCAYQERCHADVVNKLYELGIRKSDHDAMLATLIEENYLNEERFAIAFAGGKFRIKSWGRVLIRYELNQRKISEYCIKKAMKEIPDDQYLQVLEKLAREKNESLKGQQHLVKRKKLATYLSGKGFEHDLIRNIIAKITGEE